MTRRLNRIYALLLLLLTVPGAVAQFTGPAKSASEGVNYPQTITTDPAILFPPQRDIRLQPGDTVGVSIFASDYSATDKISLDGYLRLPLIGPVQVQGLSPHEAEHLIATRLQTAGMYVNPQVILNVTESPNQVATVMGEAHAVVPVLVPKRLFDVLAIAGGIPASASHSVTIQRPGVPQPIVVDLGNNPLNSAMSNIPIFAGDTVLLGRTGNVYILGAVKNASPLPLTQSTPLTLMQAVALGGGLQFAARANDTKIIRTVGTQRTMINVHLRKVLDGKEPDPVLQSDDLIIVPTSRIRSAIQSGGISTALGIASLLLYVVSINR